MKYIRTVDNQIILFSDSVKHDEFLKMFKKNDIMSAGIFKLILVDDLISFKIDIKIIGDSYSLKLKPEKNDYFLIKIFLGI